MNETIRFEFKTKQELATVINRMKDGGWVNLSENDNYFQEMAELTTRLQDKLDWWNGADTSE